VGNLARTGNPFFQFDSLPDLFELSDVREGFLVCVCVVQRDLSERQEACKLFIYELRTAHMKLQCFLPQ